MGFKSMAVKPIAKYVANGIRKWSMTAVQDQLDILSQNVNKARHTVFGKDHFFDEINNYGDFKSSVPIRDYEGLRNYVDLIIQGKKDVLWPGRPKYFAKTSGTTSGVKYIPLTSDSMPNHMNTARGAMMCYIAETGKFQNF